MNRFVISASVPTSEYNLDQQQAQHETTEELRRKFRRECRVRDIRPRDYAMVLDRWVFDGIHMVRKQVWEEKP